MRPIVYYDITHVVLNVVQACDLKYNASCHVKGGLSLKNNNNNNNNNNIFIYTIAT